MSNMERRRAVRPPRAPRPGLRNGLRPRVAAVIGSACLVLSAAPIFGLLGGSQAGGITTSSAPLGVAIASYDGDAVTSTPSESALAGTDVTDQVTVSNTTASTQTNVSVPVVLPANFTLHNASLTPSTGTTTVAANVLTWTIPSLAAGDSATLSYTETTDAPAALQSDTTSASATSDQVTTAATASAAVEVVPAADLTIGVTDGTDTVAPGASDTYTITLTNNGPSPATDATVTDTFDGPFAAVSDIASIGGTLFTDLGGGQFDWTGVDLASGASATFTLIGNAPSPLTAGSAFVSLATISLPPEQVGTDASSNAIDSDVVSGAASSAPLGVAIASYDGDAVTSTPSESALAGTDVTDQVTVSNTTASTQTNVSVPVVLPANFTLHNASLTPSTGTTTVAANVLTWTIPSLAAGDSATLSYTETTDAPAALESDTTSASATSDQVTTAATASAAVEVVPAADLTIGVTDGTDTVAPGVFDTETITLTNNGPSPATNATVVDTLNGGFTPLFAMSSIGASFGDLGPDQFAWSGFNLDSGASATFSITGSVSAGLTAGSAFVSLATASLPPGQVDTDASSSAIDSDSVIPAAQAINFTPPALGVAGQSVTLSATGGASGNPVVFSVDPSSGAGVCSVSGVDGTTLSYALAGSCVIDADQAGNASYAAAPTVTASIPVDQPPAFTLDSPPTVGTVGQDYASTFAASGVPTPSYSLAPGAPSWLSLDATTGALSGSPPAGTTSFAYSVIATNDVGNVTAGPFTVTVSPGTTSPDADISATLSCPATVQVRTLASCTLTVTNTGPAAAKFVAAGVSLPFRFWRASATPGGLWFDNTGVWFRRSLPSGSSATYTVSFRAWRPGRGWVWAAGQSRSPDPDQANNVATATVTVTR